MEERKSNGLAKTNDNGAETEKLAADFGDVYVKKAGDGTIMKPIKSVMALKQKANHLYYVSGNFGITIDGYRHCNKVASISTFGAPTVIVDGKERPNPYIERHRRTKIIKSVSVRKFGIGHSPAGNLVIIDKTLHYNLYTYFIQSVQAKMNKKKYDKDGNIAGLKYPNCAKLGEKEDRPKENGKWVWFEMEDPLGIWVNYEDSAIISCMEEHTQRQRFADRIAQTIVERNIYKSHPAIGVSQVAPFGGYSLKQKNAEGFVTVYGYQHDLNAQKMNELISKAEKGDEAIDVKMETIEEVEKEEEKEAMDDVRKDEKDLEENFELTPPPAETEGEEK